MKRNAAKIASFHIAAPLFMLLQLFSYCCNSFHIDMQEYDCISIDMQEYDAECSTRNAVITMCENSEEQKLHCSLTNFMSCY